jgi:hypothetical protein
MNKIVLTSMLAFLMSGMVTAQDQLENPGFEEWEDILTSPTDTIREPTDWSSLKTSDNDQLSTLAPVVCKRSSDAHSGDYSIKLTNVMSLIVANGTATNGRVHPNLNTSLAYMYTDTLDDRWNTPFTFRPDSVTGWFKYAPQNNDSLQVKIILHRGFGKQPDAEYMDNWIALVEFKSSLNTGSQWVRFSVPFTYFSEETPEYILVVLNSGNGYNPVPGSIAYFDDFEMIYNSPQTSTASLVNAEGYIYTIGSQYIVLKDMPQFSYNSAGIHDLTGRLVWSGKITSNRIDISSANLKKGIYLVTLTGKGDIYSQKIVIR